MEITIKEIIDLKLSPTYIAFLKAIYNKENDFLIELHNVANLFIMAKHLEELNMIKIVGDKLSYESFEIRTLKLIRYLSKESDVEVLNKDINEVIIHFKTITNQSRLEQALKSKSNRAHVSGRLKQGYSVQDLKDVIDLMYLKWKNDPKMRNYIRIQTFLNEEKFQGYVGLLESNDIKDFKNDI